jgi:UPF0755 protein
MRPSAANSAFFALSLAVVVLAAGWVIKASPSTVAKPSVRVRALSTSDTVFIDVKQGDNAATIGRELEDAGVIESGASFQLLARATGAERKLAAGEYEFEPGTSVVDALSRIRNGLTNARVITIPEGLRSEEIGAILERRGIVKAKDFVDAVNAYQAAAPSGSLIATRPAGTPVEGYLFPATYSFSRKATAMDVVTAMAKAMEDRFTPAMREQARAQGLSPAEVLNLAAIVEREVIVPEERPIVASVYLNRLRLGIALQADPTVQYAVGPPPGATGIASYWKRDLTAQDLQSPSPYNTYARMGLPPAPIANPGLDSILAVLQPAKTDYLYFVAKPDGSHAFSATFEEHQRNVQRYQP